MASQSDSKDLRSDSKAAIAAKTREFDLVPLESFDTSKFPTNADVLRRIFYLSDLSYKRPVKSIIDQVFTEMEDIYKRALAIERSTKQSKNSICLKISISLRNISKQIENNPPKINCS